MKKYFVALYNIYRIIYWRLIGGRRIDVFGQSLKVDPLTDFPYYRTHPIPSGSHKSRIVRYVDYVQQHAIADLISRANSPLTIIEVGAHQGGYAVILGKLLGSIGGKVVAIEPNPISFEILKKNVHMNGLDNLVTCVHAAISDTPGILSISDKGIQSQLVAHGEGAEVTVMTLG